MRVVFDSWALLALLKGEEPGAGVVLAHIERAERAGNDAAALHMSWINLGEVFYIVRRLRGEVAARETLENIRLLPLKLHEPSSEDVLNAARIKSERRLSYADAFAVALAQKFDAILVTGDPEIWALEDIVRVELIYRMNTRG